MSKPIEWQAADRQADRQADKKWAGEHTCREAGRQTGGQSGRQESRQFLIQASGRTDHQRAGRSSEVGTQQTQGRQRCTAPGESDKYRVRNQAGRPATGRCNHHRAKKSRWPKPWTGSRGPGALQRCKERAKWARKQIDIHGKMDGIFVPLYAQKQQREADIDSNNVTHLTLNPEVFLGCAIKHSTSLFLEVFKHKLGTKN